MRSEAPAPPARGAGGGGTERVRRPRRPAARWAGPALLAVVLGLALLWGSGAFDSGPTSAAQSARAIESTIRCPSCVDVSVADSAAATAASLRQQILHWVREGRSEQQIDNILVSRYGLSILLKPPTSGLAAVVWVVPALAGAAGVVGVVTLFWRRSRSMRALQAGGSGGGGPGEEGGR